MSQLFHLWKQVTAKYRRHCHRHRHGGQNGNDISNTKRRKQTPFDTRQGEQGNKHQHDDDCGVHNAGANFNAGLLNYFHHRLRLRKGSVFLEST